MKRFISFILALVMVVCALPTMIIAQENEESGVLSTTEIIKSGYCGGSSDGKNLSYTLDSEGTLTISGNGSMKSYDNVANRPPWYDNSGGSRRVKNIIITRALQIYPLQPSMSAIMRSQ